MKTAARYFGHYDSVFPNNVDNARMLIERSAGSIIAAP
jgi:hypothetical protein